MKYFEMMNLLIFLFESPFLKDPFFVKALSKLIFFWMTLCLENFFLGHFGRWDKWKMTKVIFSFFFLVSSFFRIHGGSVTLNNFLDISNLNFFNIKIFFDNANNELTMIVLDRNSHILRELFYPKAFLSSWNYHNF